MILFVRQAKYRVGKGEAALNWAKKVTDYINKTFPDNKVSSYSNRFGFVSAIFWTVKFNDLLTLDKWQNDLGKDNGYIDLVKQVWNEEVFVDGSFEDSVLVSIN